ncbi:MAG TPA: DUF6465 family protein [Ruminococcus sp.]|mgnify:CR=1 FL=1|nr:hypothetical protein [Ruminococcus sp.]HRR76309.1 DUF6465 family protein [Ruminococcus sp.]
MPRAKKTAVETAEVKETVVAAAPAEEKKAPAKKAAEKKAPAKKPAAKKAPAKKPAAKKETAEERKVFIQYNGAEVAGTDLIDKAKAVAGVKTAKSVVVYVRPEINKVYYVIDDNTFGNFDLF